MKNWILVYTAKKEKTRLSIDAAVFAIDENCATLKKEAAILFRTDKPKEELHRLLVSEQLEPGDESWIFEAGKEFTGNGFALEEVRKIMY